MPVIIKGGFGKGNKSIVAKSAYLVIFVRGESQTCPLAVIGIKKINDCLGLVSTNPDKELIIEYAIYWNLRDASWHPIFFGNYIL